MPELPEVETMVRGIHPHVVGRRIQDVRECPNSCKRISIVPSFRKLRLQLVSKTISNAHRRGKRIVFDLNDGSNLVIEPRMTGLILLADPPDVQHLRLEWTLAGNAKFNAFWFWDRRGLGTVRLLKPGQLQVALGPDIVGRDALEMTGIHWEKCCSRTSRPVKVVMLDQSVVAGIGNLYASEILHRAAIHPAKAANTLKPQELARLTDAAKSILEKAIEYEGSTLADGTYRNALNQSGRYQNEHQVYMREGQICRHCEKGTVVRIVQAQRSTFYCPRCQKG